MILKIEFSTEARNDLRQIREYISIDLGNEQSARKIVGNIINSIGRLKDLPEIGAPLSSRIGIQTGGCIPNRVNANNTVSAN